MNIQLMVFNPAGERGEGEEIVLVNPVVQKATKKTLLCNEGCLSFPGIFADIERPASVKIDARDIKGARFRFNLSKLPARVFQHEFDHLQGDRFIPDRSAMDFDVAHCLLTQPRKEKEKNEVVSPAKEAYRKILAQTFLNNRSRILVFCKRPPTATEGMLTALYDSASSNQNKVARTKRYIPQSADRTLDAPDLVDDFYLNLLDWGSRNVLSIALDNTVYLWNSSKGSPSELLTVQEDIGPVTSVNWAPDGQQIAIGLNNSDVQLWDSSSVELVRTTFKLAKICNHLSYMQYFLLCSLFV
ncbi:hypothetical protein HPP92_016029 [Vanilla planifolia]|uniref:peptide deformylase n=1 Tax=Vanilla planifolia TaxID=51239 RepID=A0A835UU82_VANPL|nr:hypothetical protein HPP92_016029 [Vanilla planifolia]